MKKFLVILMVVAMASFLFVGCMPAVTPDVDDEEDEEVVVAKTDTPYITSIDDGNVVLYSTETQYAKGLTTEGISVAGAVIKLYVNGVQAGIANSGTVGEFSVTRSMIKLTEGVKKLYVTATVPGLAESDKSTEYTFTVDTTAPKIASAVADSTDEYITVTFNEAVKATKMWTGTTSLAKRTAWAMSALNPDIWVVTIGDKTQTLVTSNFVATSSKVIRITPTDVGNVGTVFAISCTGIGDSLGNTSTTPSTAVGIVVK